MSAQRRSSRGSSKGRSGKGRAPRKALISVTVQRRARRSRGGIWKALLAFVRALSEVKSAKPQGRRPAAPKPTAKGSDGKRGGAPIRTGPPRDQKTPLELADEAAQWEDLPDPDDAVREELAQGHASAISEDPSGAEAGAV